MRLPGWAADLFSRLYAGLCKAWIGEGSGLILFASNPEGKKRFSLVCAKEPQKAY
ncbi:hypothetical protein COCC4DRAFT_34202 [Bipolaris maydis ATCC 48331]|uniref:Uncharacterized protein n=2 Tax=Cochliobolus heterostrophus TaxID=5016 RepID=M2V5F2_COCH5|nr:uncharacterized protein COCC4DRAFT_34202 [Bipolaris maydis ATCC 48331]EMD95218.1 hypothetical protein COCHEDRAFT_1019994 [Bipolaris maydis C5]ENI00891.1 hypothetical protein COCC4DRAFT_34202 [Bipolaris maydis ATCC 48331]